MEEALKLNKIHKKQHGFQSNKSTEMAMSSMVSYIEGCVMRRKQCVGVFLDISAAFDSISPKYIKNRLLTMGGDPAMVDWYLEYITYRTLMLDMHGVKSKLKALVGFPQGGVCSALFWIIAFDPAIKILNKFGINGNGFADDCAAVLGGTWLRPVLLRLQIMINELTVWGRKCGLRFNADKTVVVHFTRRRKTPPYKLMVEGNEIEYSSEVKYLGVLIDSGLYWRKHVENKLNKAKGLLHLMVNATCKIF